MRTPPPPSPPSRSRDRSCRRHHRLQYRRRPCSCSQRRHRHRSRDSRPAAPAPPPERRAPPRREEDLPFGTSSENPELMRGNRSEEHTSELKSLMLNSYAVFCLKTQNAITIVIHDLS